jgi:hypothetical protein
MIKISLSVTSDGPQGQPWPPSESDALWSIVRRADGCTVWRAIELAESDPLPRTLQFRRGSNRNERISL